MRKLKTLLFLALCVLLFYSCDKYFTESTTFDTIGGCDYMIVTGTESNGEIQFKSYTKLDCNCKQVLKNTTKKILEPKHD